MNTNGSPRFWAKYLEQNRILVIMFSNFTNLVYELPNEVRLRILGNKEILGISQIWVKTQPSAKFPFQKSKLWQQQSKNIQNQISNFSFPVQFYWVSLFFSNILLRIEPWLNTFLFWLLNSKTLLRFWYHIFFQIIFSNFLKDKV